MLDLSRLRAAPLVRDPFDHIVVPGFLHGRALAEVLTDFPAITAPGLLPVGALQCHGAFARLIDEIGDPALAQAFGNKFGLALGDHPLMITVRGFCRARDGVVHTDSRSKIISALLYLNEDWGAAGGRLRILRSEDLEDVAAEISPQGGTLVAFRRGESSFHGHPPFAGPRRYVMFNWLTSAAAAAREETRHRLSAGIKSLAHTVSR